MEGETDEILDGFQLPNVVFLEAQNTDLRSLIAKTAVQTKLKIYASPDVQGMVNCHINTKDGDEVFRRLLMGTSFLFRREGDFVYIGTRREMARLPQPLSTMGTRTYVPRYLDRNHLKITLEMNLSPLGTCTFQGEGILVRDVELAIRDLDRLVPLLDVPGKRPKLDAFVFQHETDSLRKRLDLTKVAENRNVTLQELNPPEKKPETAPHIYTISQRLDTFLIGLEDQKETALISDRALSADLAMNTPLAFPFLLKRGDETLRCGLNVLLKQENADALSLTVDVQPQNAVEPEPVHVQSVLEMEQGWIFQCRFGEYRKPRDTKKPFAFHDPKSYVDVVVVLAPRLEEPPRPKTDLTTKAIRYFAKQQEDWGYKKLSNASPEDAAFAKRFIGTGLRLKNFANEPEM